MSLALALLLVAGPSASSPFILVERFEGDRVGDAWQVDVAPGGEVAVRDGRLQIRTALNSFAHIERALDRDNVTVSALVQPSVPAGVSWSCGVLLYWAPGAWCQLSIIDFQDGQYYAVEAPGGRRVENYLEKCDRTKPHWLRIELGTDCVRYLTRTPEQSAWTRQRTVARPTAWAGPPKLLVLGKGYGEGVEPYAAPDLDNNYSDLGPPIEAQIDEVIVEPTPRGRLTAKRGELAPAGDVVGEAILARPGDPTYEPVAAVYPPLRHPREAVGPKEHPEEVGVTETGALEVGTATVDNASQPLIVQFQVGSDSAAFGTGDPRAAKRLLDGHYPIVVASWEHEGIAYEETVLGHSRGLAPDAPLFACVRLAATNETGEARTTPVRLTVSPAEWAASSPATQLDLPPKGTAAWCLRIPCPLPRGGAAEQIGEGAFEVALAETHAFWKEEFARGMQIDVPDARLMDAYRAWLAYNAIDVDKVGDICEPHDGSGFYEAVFGYSAARYAWVLDLYARHDDAQRYLEGMLSHQSEDGLFTWNFGLPDHGMLLIGLADHWRLTGDAAWFRHVALRTVQACDWIARQRAEQKDATPLTRGLIRFRPYCDYAEPVYSYLGDCYCCVGMERIAEALRAIGMEEDAGRVAAEAARYRRDILASMRASSLTVRGRRVIPMEPDSQRLLRDSGYTSRDYYGLVASMLLETGFLPPKGPEAQAIARFLREDGGIQLGVSEFAGGIDHAYGYGYLEHQLVCGRPERYVLGLYASLAYGMSRETFSSVECTQIKTGENALTLPHLYSGTQQLLLVRTMLVREEGDRLILCSATPRTWLADGKHIEVRGAATRFGPLSFRLESSTGRGEIRAWIGSPGRQPPREIVLCLRHPRGKPIASVTVDGRPWDDFKGDRVYLAPGPGTTRVVAQY